MANTMKRQLVIVVIVLAVLAVAVFAFSAGLGGGESRTPSPEPTDEPAAAPSRLPDVGTYAYATTGGEEVDALGGSRNDYPARTVITVSHGGCGLIERWDVADGRWEERETCAGDDGDELRRYTSVRTFFGRTDERTFTCEEGTVLYPADPDATESVSGTCTSEETVATFTGSVVGTETVEIAGEEREALHVRIETTASGDATGSGSRDTWIDTETGLILRERAETTSERQQAFVGTVRYTESYEITLESLEPSE